MVLVVDVDLSVLDVLDVVDVVELDVVELDVLDVGTCKGSWSLAVSSGVSLLLRQKRVLQQHSSFVM